MTIQVELSSETEALLAVKAAAHSMDVPAYAASLLEQAAHPPPNAAQDADDHSVRQRPAGRKNLAQLFADSPFKGLDLDFERDADLGREIEL